MTNIILCGGNGTRLWPISRTLLPKQFVKLFQREHANGAIEEESLFQLTVKRNQTLCSRRFVISNAEQYFLAVDQLEELNLTQNRFLLEPVGRNTAPAIALACFASDPDEILLVSSSDHLIKNQNAYAHVLQRARELAEQDNLVTFGITADYAHTGYGYIEADHEDVKAFHEKPDARTAQSYVDAGNFYWNSGMFCFKAGILLQELKRYAPEIYQASQSAYERAKEGEVIRIAHDDMYAIPEESIDYAVMEKSDRVKVVASNIDWSDLGSFDTLYEEMPQDNNGNTQYKDLYAIDSHNNFVYSKERAVALVDVDDLIVVDTSDALLISKKGASQKVKQLVKEIKAKGSQLHHIHLTAHRPWGTYTILEDTEGFKIKHIEVKPGKRLSLQKHFHRNEHWVVVSGTATVTVNNETKLVRPNESTYIKMGEIHRLENQGKIPVILIEVQVGEYTAEDDIIRIEDDFKRE